MFGIVSSSISDPLEIEINGFSMFENKERLKSHIGHDIVGLAAVWKLDARN